MARITRINWTHAGKPDDAMKPPKKSKPSSEVKLVRSYEPLNKVTPGTREYLVTETRGVLSRMTFISMADDANRQPHFPDPWGIYNDVCQELREILEQNDLPTDKTRLMPEELDVFEKRLCDDEVLWYYDVVHSTERLSEARLAGDLLMVLIELGKLEGIDDYILHFGTAMFRYGEFRASQINSLATAGAAAVSNRAAGPLAKSKKRESIRRIVWRRAEECWQSSPRYIGLVEGTASEIARLVNADLVIAGLASKADRSIKTIGDDIRAGRDAKVFPNWPIRRDT
jgi:hypothetical protein